MGENVNANTSSTNIVIGSGNSAGGMLNSSNIVIGSSKTESRNNAVGALPVGAPVQRMANTSLATVIGSGELAGRRADGQLETIAGTVVPDGCLLFGVGVPVQNGGANQPNTDNHMIIDNFVAVGGAPAAADTSIFIWYNGIRYALHATAV